MSNFQRGIFNDKVAQSRLIGTYFSKSIHCAHPNLDRMKNSTQRKILTQTLMRIIHYPVVSEE